MIESSCSIPAGANVLVTGASGFTGSRLVRRLVAAGVNVRGISRTATDIDHLNDLDIRWFRGDVFDPEVVARAVEGVEYIINMVAVFREFGVPYEMYDKVHVQGTLRLAEAALKAPDFKRFVHVSTVGVHSHIDDPPADENYRFQPDDIYQRTKAEGELQFRAFVEKEGLPYCVIRPTPIFGPGDRRLLKLFKMATKPFFVLLGPVCVEYHLVHIEDLVNVLMLAATHEAALDDVFICGNPEALTIRRIVEIIADSYNRGVRFIRLPATPFFAVAALCEWACLPFKIHPPLNRRRLAFYTKHRCFDTRKVREKLGYTFMYNTESGLRQTAAWYKENGWIGA